MVLLAAWAAAQLNHPAGAQTGSTYGSNRMRLWVEDSLRAASYLNQFDVEHSSGNWVIGARLELDEETFRYDEEQGIELRRRYAEYSDGQFYARGGNFYITFGKGLLLRAMEDEDVRIDRDLDGLHGRVNWKNLEGQAILGRPRDDDTHERDDMLSGIDLDLQALPNLKIGGGYVRLDARAEHGDPHRGRPIEELAGGRFAVSHGIADLEVEGAARLIHGRRFGDEWIGTHAEDGHAYYAALTLGVPGYVFTLEGKDYENFDNPYSTPPPANYDGQPINPERNEHGVGLSGTASPKDDITIEAHGSYAEAAGDAIPADRGAAGGFFRKDWWGKGALQIGGTWVHEQGVQNHVDRKYYGPTLNVDYYLSELMSVQLVSHVYARSDTLSGYLDDYTEIATDVTFSHAAGRALTLSMIKTSIAPHEFEGADDLWLQAQLTWTFGHSHDLTIKVGEERGGLVCSGGVCVTEAPFSGVRVELTSRL